jgi:hypothetical protein
LRQVVALDERSCRLVRVIAAHVRLALASARELDGGLAPPV